MTDGRSKKHLNILLWRTWAPLYDYPAVYSSINNYSIGGTCSQLLWHAQSLVEMGHSVQVLGVAREDVAEEQVEFIGSLNRDHQEALMKTGRVRSPDIIFLEGAFEAAELFHSVFPKAKLVHVGQNIDRHACRKAFAIEKSIDIYAFVSPGHLADYCTRYPRLRHKFMLIRNVIPWDRLYRKVIPNPVENRILWVGAWTKHGLRQWAETMQRVLIEFPSYRWVLCGPSHGSHVGGLPPYIFNRLRLPKDRISVRSLPLIRLAEEISSARIILASLGNETACISALDAHAMGRPVLSGNDMVFKYNNPEGTGIRVTTAGERYEAITRLINDPGLCDSIGAMGKEMILSDYSEKNQLNDVKKVLNYLSIKDSLGSVTAYSAPGSWKESFIDIIDRVKRKTLSLSAVQKTC